MVKPGVWKNALALCVYLNCFFYAIGVENNEAEKESNSTQKVFIKAGESFLLPTENCGEHVYNIYCSKSSSIISISAQPGSSKDTRSPEGTGLIIDDRSVQITFKENVTLKDEEKSLISTNKWTITPANIHDEHFLLSRTSRLQMSIIVKGNWSNNVVDISTQEEEFKGYEKTFEDASEVIKPWKSIKGRSYRPNSVYLSHINAELDNSINITLKMLDIDVAIGEYLLIGSGTNPFEGPPSLFITSKSKKNEYKIFDKNAYIVFVSHSSSFDHKGFEITWSQNRTTDPNEDVNEHLSHDDIMQSVQICIYNKSAAFLEFNRKDSFREFREKVSEIASNYAKENRRRDTIKPSQVEIFRVSDVIREDPTVENLKAGGLYVMVKIKGSEKGSAAFRRNELAHIMETYYNRENATDLDGTAKNKYKIESCPPQLPPNVRNKIVFYAIIPILCCALLAIWALRHSRFSKKFSKRMKGGPIQLKKSQRTSEIQAENVYTSDVTLPKVRIINDQGRRHTLSFDELNSDSEVEVYNRNHFKRPSIMHGDLRGFYQMGNTNEGFIDDDEKSIALRQIGGSIQETQSNEIEHFYDTVKSEKRSIEEQTPL